MVRVTVSRNDSVYECFPDIARTADGTLVCIYRECMEHGPFPFSRLAVRRSFDEGMNWTDRSILIDCVSRKDVVDARRDWLEPDALAGYEESLARIAEPWQRAAGLNCPRIICLSDGTLLLFADFTVYGAGDERRCVDLLWKSADGGQSWQGPDELGGAQTGYQPAPTKLKDRRILLGMDFPGGGTGICFSEDGGRRWGSTAIIPTGEEKEPDEVSYVELGDGTLVGFGRNLACERARRPSCGLKVISQDGGKRWQGPYETWLMGLQGRPKAGLLRSGEVCVSYRCSMPNEMLALHLMTQEAAKLTHPADLIERRAVAEDVAARLAKERRESRPWYMTSYYPGRTFIVDMDRSVHRDRGYSGWVVLSNGDLFLVDYTNDDAPLAQIRGYRVSRSDYLMFPEGDLPWLHPSNQPFRAITHALSREQRQTNARAQRERGHGERR